MSFICRCRMLTLGIVLWTAVTFQVAQHYPLSALGFLHAGLAGFVGASAFLPRTMLHWA